MEPNFHMNASEQTLLKWLLALEQPYIIITNITISTV